MAYTQHLSSRTIAHLREIFKDNLSVREQDCRGMAKAILTAFPHQKEEGLQFFLNFIPQDRKAGELTYNELWDSLSKGTFAREEDVKKIIQGSRGR